MRKVILNIGLETRDADGNVTHVDVDALGDAIAELTDGVGFYGSTVETHTELTLVVEFDRDELNPLIGTAWICEQLCEQFNQDCIALYYDSSPKQGLLVGPRAQEWGDFDPSRFFLLDGTSLISKIVDELQPEVLQ